MKKDNGIFIQNIYCMMSYAFKSLTLDVYKNMAVEPFDNMHNMFAYLLEKCIGSQLKQGLYREYINRQESLPGLRGKLNMPGTIRNRMAHKQLLTCEFDELSENNLSNQIIKTTVRLLIRHGMVKAAYKDKLTQQMRYFSNVECIEPFTIQWSALKYPRGFRNYRMLIGICQLVIRGMLTTTTEGKNRLAAFIDDQRMYHLYEKFILEYYRWHFPMLDVRAAQIPWALDDEIGAMLPVMQSDIQLKMGNRVLIIDAKFYGRITQTYYKQTLRSNHMYQIFTYVKNKEYEFGDEEHQVSGMLLYAKTEEEIQPDNEYSMHGNKISVKNLDLNVPFKDIQKQLNAIAKSHFGLEPSM